MHLRRARPEDYDEIGAVTVAAYEPVLAGAEGTYVQQLRNAQARDLEAELWVAVGADDREVLGTVTLCRDGSPWREIAAADEGEFRMLAVAPQAQGRGVGQALARHCVDRFRESGASGVVLSSTPGMAGAHRLYGRLGFVREAGRDWEPVPGVQLWAFRLDFSA
jgi:predicted N-acetyltransferase YhbS